MINSQIVAKINFNQVLSSVVNQFSDFDQTSTETLISMYHSTKADATALVFGNPTESRKLSDLSLRIRVYLNRKRYTTI